MGPMGAPWAPWGPHGAPWGPHGAPWGPQGVSPIIPLFPLRGIGSAAGWPEAYYAGFLESRPEVASVSYAGLPSSKYNALVKKYCPKGASGLFTFSHKAGFEGAKKVVN